MTQKTVVGNFWGFCQYINHTDKAHGYDTEASNFIYENDAIKEVFKLMRENLSMVREVVRSKKLNVFLYANLVRSIRRGDDWKQSAKIWKKLTGEKFGIIKKFFRPGYEVIDENDELVLTIEKAGLS